MFFMLRKASKAPHLNDFQPSGLGSCSRFCVTMHAIHFLLKIATVVIIIMFSQLSQILECS